METSIQKYEAFLESYRQGSFTRAAASLSYSQSGVSRMVADLERDWQLTLLERGRGPLRLTSDGRRLLPLVQEVCEGNRRLRMEIDDLRGVQSGSIRIGTFSSVATHWLPSVISRFQADYHNIDMIDRHGIKEKAKRRDNSRLQQIFPFDEYSDDTVC